MVEVARMQRWWEVRQGSTDWGLFAAEALLLARAAGEVTCEVKARSAGEPDSGVCRHSPSMATCSAAANTEILLISYNTNKSIENYTQHNISIHDLECILKSKSIEISVGSHSMKLIRHFVRLFIANVSANTAVA